MEIDFMKHIDRLNLYKAVESLDRKDSWMFLPVLMGFLFSIVVAGYGFVVWELSSTMGRALVLALAFMLIPVYFENKELQEKEKDV